MDTGIDALWSSLFPAFTGMAARAALAFARGLGAFMLMPTFLAATYPRQLRTAIPLAMLPLVWLSLGDRELPSADGGMGLYLLWLAAEFAIGLLLTLPVGLLMFAAQSAGELIDIKTGANNSAVFGALPDAPSGPAQTLMVQLALAAFVAAGGLQAMAAALCHSYRLVPVGDYARLSIDGLPTLAVTAMGQLMTVTWHVFGPLLVVFLLVEIGIGLAAKMSPQLQVGTVTAPLKSLVFPLLLLVLLRDPTLLGLPTELGLAQLSGMLGTLSGTMPPVPP